MPKFASVVMSYFGDSKFVTLFQETTKLKKAMEGYDHVVLLKHDATPKVLDFSEKDEKIADVVEKPTSANLVKHIQRLAKEGYIIDIWIFSHGNTESFRTSTGEHGSKDSFTTDDIKTLLAPATAGLEKMPIRMVYQVSCYAQTMNDAWISIGAKVACGARYVNFYPTQFGKFADQWNKGDVAVRKALDESDTAESRTVVQTYILADALATRGKEWEGCPFGKTVLGSHDCAKDYFLSRWIDEGEWQGRKNGKENMNHSSEMIVAGNGSITKNSTPTW